VAAAAPNRGTGRRPSSAYHGSEGARLVARLDVSRRSRLMSTRSKRADNVRKEIHPIMAEPQSNISKSIQTERSKTTPNVLLEEEKK